MIKNVFAIYSAWFDSLENHPAAAFGYSLSGIVFDEELAKRICLEAGKITKKKYGWAGKEGRPVKYYEPVTVLENNNGN